METGKQKNPMTAWVGEHSTAVFSAINWYSGKREFEGRI